MTQQDENDLTDEELLEMWQRGEPVEVAQPSDTPVSEEPAEKSSPRDRREARSQRTVEAPELQAVGPGQYGSVVTEDHVLIDRAGWDADAVRLRPDRAEAVVTTPQRAGDLGSLARSRTPETLP